MSVWLRSQTVPVQPRCMCEMENGSAGRQYAFSRLATRWATASTKSVSVANGRCLLCCSVAPTGRIAIRGRPRRTSSVVLSAVNISLSDHQAESIQPEPPLTLSSPPRGEGIASSCASAACPFPLLSGGEDKGEGLPLLTRLFISSGFCSACRDGFAHGIVASCPPPLSSPLGGEDKGDGGC